MKKLIILALLVAAIGANAQVLVKIKSKQLGDSIYINRGAAELTSFVINANGDTARSFDYSINCSRDSLSQTALQINIYDKRAAQIGITYLSMPDPIFTHWLLFYNRIDLYIQAQRKKIVKQ